MYRPARRLSLDWCRERPVDPRRYVLIASADAAASSALDAAFTGLLDAGWSVNGAEFDYEATSYAALADLARCVFGNPFRPVTINPSWLTPTVVSLADGIYQERAYNRMPSIVDALRDSGCDNEDILNHCRWPGEHVRGCWVVDLLLKLG